jgi:hypothetical protein
MREHCDLVLDGTGFAFSFFLHRYLERSAPGARAFARDFPSRNPGVRQFQRPETDPLEQFLLSTDFFQDGGDETRTVPYVALYDPYLNPCWNPCNPIA